jgi:alpha-mannosidase
MPNLRMVSCLLLVSAGAPAAQERTEVFTIGTKDKSFIEFSRLHEPGAGVMYRVRESSAKNWPAYQPGTFDSQVGRSTMQRDWMEVQPGATAKPFQVQFDVSSAPMGTFVLHLDAILRYRRPAAPRYAVSVNGRSAGSYRLDPHPAPELWWPNGGEGDGNLQYFGYASLDMPLPASLFVRGTNTLSLHCVDGYGIYYDDISLTNTRSVTPPVISDASVDSTILYKDRPSGLMELARVRVRTTTPLGKVTLKLFLGTTQLEFQTTQDDIGDIESTIEVPATDVPVPVTLHVAGVEKAVYRGTFTPKRRWKVYALPMEQADFGYNDLPARTLEWENRFIDTTLAIQAKYPSYSFTLDAAANLESYLATRNGEQGTRLLEHLRSGKWGMNALYANFFTGLMTPEEMYRALEFALRAGKQHRFVVDSASQTDEPSVSWALPQILADAGIQYFTNGSDPIRGALNPIGLLNLRSPFYWEAPTGAKVLVWSGVSYTAVDDMTWGGWNAESVATGTYTPSILGLTRSLPLFLSQYEREDFPFDGVQLFGLHNDEIPMRHWGDADVIDMWNQEYAYPRVIPATQRDFFQYISSQFGDRIQTLRGDAGAYWEDEAGADARIAAMIRAAQMQVVAAEKFDSIARWLQPHLRVDRQPFDEAWKNILLADSYVWSDANSFRRPESYRTREGEAAHRAWAEAAWQQTKDLRLTAMDKIAELVRTDRQGAVVLNPESWPRSDFFDFELEPDEAFLDPASGQLLPCGSMRSLHGYQEVRCWASDVPAMGYKFYAITKGRVPAGEAVPLDRLAPTIANKHYLLQLDSKTGAIAHLIDRSTGLDLVNSAMGYQMNEYLYVSGGDPGSFIPGSVKDNRLLAADVTLPLPELTIHRGTVVDGPQARRFPWGTVVTIRSKATNTPAIISTITLLDAAKQIDIRNDVQKTATQTKEGIYFAFPFALKQPEIRYQGATAWVDPERDMLPGANRQWFTTQGGVWAKVADNAVTWTTVDAPLITLQDINRGSWPASIEIRDGTVFSYVMNNYWYTDTPAQQGGQFTFRYSLSSGPDVSLARALTLAAAERSPLFAIRRYNMGWEPILAERGEGFLSASPSGIKLLTIRPADNGNGYLLRLQNGTPDDVTASIRFHHLPIQEAYLGSVLGERDAPVHFTAGEITLPMHAYEIKSIVVQLGKRAAI